MENNAKNSMYCYPGTNVLKNKLNIRDSNKLFEIEKQIVLVKSYILRQNKIRYTFDKRHFTYLHDFLFSDIYPFAGKFRTENIYKGSFTFASWEYIESELDRLLKELKSENFLQGLDKENLSKRLAYYLSELNVLHPFREGHGRTIREFIREIAMLAGFTLDLQNTTPEEMFNACVKSVYDTTDLEQIIFSCLLQN